MMMIIIVVVVVVVVGGGGGGSGGGDMMMLSSSSLLCHHWKCRQVVVAIKTGKIRQQFVLKRAQRTVFANSSLLRSFTSEGWPFSVFSSRLTRSNL